MITDYERAVKAQSLSIDEAVDKVIHYFNLLIVDPKEYHHRWTGYGSSPNHMFCLRTHRLNHEEKMVAYSPGCGRCPMRDPESSEGCTSICEVNSVSLLNQSIISVYEALREERYRADAGYSIDGDSRIYGHYATLVKNARIRRDAVIYRLKETNSYHIE